MSTYLATSVVQQLDDAQRMLDALILLLTTETCRLCGTVSSCEYRDAASATFARYRRLPR